jgi:ribose 5-phosphate isomerase A
MDSKQRAAEAAMGLIEDGMVVGLGTGSTADYFLQALGRAVSQGRLRNIRGVPTSRRSEIRGRELHIPLTTLAEVGTCDITVDGADEIAPNLDVIKGLGGALLREKIVAQNSRQLVIIADHTKLVETLGTRSPLPVEVASFGYEVQEPFLRKIGCIPSLRMGGDGMVFVTDNSNIIFDCRFTSIPDPQAIEQALHGRAGIVETGLFIALATTVLVAHPDRVQRLDRAGR